MLHSPSRALCRIAIAALISGLALGSLAPTALPSLAAGPAPGHDRTRPLAMQEAAKQLAGTRVWSATPLIAPLGEAATLSATTMSTPATTRPTREVFGYALASSIADPTYGYPSWNFSLLSTVAFFGIPVNNLGYLDHTQAGYQIWTQQPTANFISAAHAAGAKVLLTIIMQDTGQAMCTALAGSSITAQQTAYEVTTHGVDGVSIDYEGVNQTCSNGQSQQSMLTLLAQKLRAAMPSSYISIATYNSSATDPGGFFDIGSLNQSVDSFFVMDYDLDLSNNTCGAGVYCLGPTSPLAAYSYNDEGSTKQYVAKVGAAKVIMGVPYYGVKACVAGTVPNAPAAGSRGAEPYTSASTDQSDPNISQFAAHRDANDPAGEERWDTFYSLYANCTREMYWDDTLALGQKYAYVLSSGIRGVGIWNLNFGGGAPELWNTLGSYFGTCSATVTLTSPQNTTYFPVTAAATPNCPVSSFDFQQYDATLDQGWFGAGSAVATVGPNGQGVGSVSVYGYPGHTYYISARVHGAGGYTSPWSGRYTQVVSATATSTYPFRGLYTLDAYGGVGMDSSPPLAGSAYWPGWDIARSARALPGRPNPDAGAVLDGYGGLHPYGPGMSLNSTPFFGWDIARDFAFLPDGTGGYLLDGFGGVHPFGVNAHAPPPPVTGALYFGFDIARKLVVFSDETGGYVLDGWGGIHPFGIGGAAPPLTYNGGYWPGWDIAHSLALLPGTHSGYLLDGRGGLHPFAPSGQPLPALTGAGYYGWDIARDVWLAPNSTAAAPSGYQLDGWGGLHPFGSAPAVSMAPYWSGRDLGKVLAGF